MRAAVQLLRISIKTDLVGLCTKARLRATQGRFWGILVFLNKSRNLNFIFYSLVLWMDKLLASKELVKLELSSDCSKQKVISLQLISGSDAFCLVVRLETSFTVYKASSDLTEVRLRLLYLTE